MKKEPKPQDLPAVIRRMRTTATPAEGGRIDDLAHREAPSGVRTARGRREPRPECRAARARALHGAGVRPRVRQPERRDARDAHRDHPLFLALAYFVDAVRARALSFAGRSLDRLLSPAALESALSAVASGPRRVDTDALRDIAQLRGLLNGGGILALFDAPWLPVYLLAITLDAPDARPLRADRRRWPRRRVGVLNHWLTHGHAAAVLERSRASLRTAEALARNAEAVVGMGMTRAAVERWRSNHDELLGAQRSHARGLGRARRVRARTAPSTAGRHTRRRRVARNRPASLRRRDDRRDDFARPRAAARRAPHRRLAGARRCARRMAAPWRAIEALLARRRVSRCPHRLAASTSSA